MGLVAALARFVFFGLVFWFALRNTDPVNVHLWDQRNIDNVPLVVVLLVAVAIGTVGGILAMLPTVIRLSRRASRRDAQPQDRARSELTERHEAEALASAARDAGAVGDLGADTRLGRML